MAEFINLDIDYFDHIKTVRLVGRLGRGAEVLPVRLWCYCGKYHAESGKLLDYSPPEIETAILKWWGKQGDAVKALVDLGFLDKDGGSYVVHDWKSMNGHIEAFKVRAKNAAEARWAKMRGSASSNAQALPEQCPTDRPTNRPTKKEGARFSDPFGEVKKRLAESITVKKSLPSLYSLTEKESEAVSQACERYRPEVVLACWEMWWFAGEGWSDWGFKCGHGITGFLSSSGIGAILDSKRWQGKAASKKRELEAA